MSPVAVTILFLVGIHLFKVNNKNTRKWCEISLKLTKNPYKKGHLKELPDLVINSSSCGESDISSSDADSDAEL